MEAVAVSALLNILVPRLLDLYSTNKDLRKNSKDKIRDIKFELQFFIATLEDNRKWGTDITESRNFWIKEVHRFAQETDDYIELFLHPDKSLSPEDFERKIKAVKEQFKFLRETNPWPSQGSDESRMKESNQEPHHGSSEPVGMGEPIRRLLELLVQPAPESQSSPTPVVQPVGEGESPPSTLKEPSGTSNPKVVKRKVIAIVGFNGLGKTRLAKKVYNHDDVTKQFPECAWVRAAGDSELEVLQNIGKKLEENIRKKREENGASTSTGVKQAVFGCISGASSLSELSENIENYLKGKRYCIVIDDIRTTVMWNFINKSFPLDADGRIIITTTMQPVANACILENGSVYKMPTLSREMSQKLFLEAVPLAQHPDTMNDGLTGILNKCDGLPLALICVLDYLKSKGDRMFQEDTCKEACRSFNTSLINEPALKRMRDVLLKKYNGLPDHDVRACLLYFYLFPDDNPIGEGSLTRHCLAEGFLKQEACVSLQTVIENILETLIDHSIITPIQVSNKKKVKSCRPHGTMLEYISYKSVSENFITMLCGQIEEHQGEQVLNVRRLFLHDGAADTEHCINSEHLYLLRTLAVSGNASKAIMDFSKYKLLQVLDLKKCDYQLEENQLGHISNLVRLKYLSLGKVDLQKNKKEEEMNNVLARAIGRLPLLETLEMKKNKEAVCLPQEVIMRPKLKHLIGKFRLVDTPDEMLEKFVSKDCVLETFSGFVTGESRGFASLMSHMKRLRKVKIWYDSAANPDNLNDLSKAIREFTTLQGTDMSRSLSIDLDTYSQEVLNCLQGQGRLTTLKLSGDLTSFGPPAQDKCLTQMLCIEELCLSKTKLDGKAIISALSNLGSLKGLTLAEENLGQLVLTPDTFKSLERLCVVSKTRLKITIEAEALPRLISFHMICESLGGPADIQIGGLTCLQEIAVHPLVNAEIIEDWKEAAHRHPKRPNVLLIVSKFTFEDQDTPTAAGSSEAVPVDMGRKDTSKKQRSGFANFMKCFICGRRGSGTIE